jgi:alkylation response protein AidB-like acyl-CoA dehydrogenase
MDLRFTPEERAFRDEVRTFFRTALPAATRQKMLNGQVISQEEWRAWQRILDAKGWGAPHWSTEWGGTGWDPVRIYIFREEMQASPAPQSYSQNVNLVGPVIIAYGTEEQKKFFLPGIRNFDLWFCQGFSEPGAGSDLAALKTSAVRDGDHYVINGQKVWTSQAHRANWMFALVRTDPGAKKQKGITYLLMDMKTPGITVRPIITLDGVHHTNEVFFDNVRVPVANRIGEENKGWDYAKFLLGNERTNSARVGISKARLARARELAANVPDGNGRLIDNPRFREKVADIEIQLKALEITTLRVLAEMQSKAEKKQDPKTSILKMRGSELYQATAELLMEAAGPHILPHRLDQLLGRNVPPTAGFEDYPDWMAGAAPNYLYDRAASVYGGSNEIQHNVVAKGILGL